MEKDVSGVASAMELLDAGNVPSALRQLRGVAELVPLAQLAEVVARAAAMVDDEKFSGAAQAVISDCRDVPALYEFGYECIERELGYLAIPALTAALREYPGLDSVLEELAVAYEQEFRHSDAVAVLEEYESSLPVWPLRYLLVFNSIMMGDLQRARHHAQKLSAPQDTGWERAYEWVHATFARADMVGPLDWRDLRGWHFVLNAGILTSLSSYGWDDGMNGRWAFTQDSLDRCLFALHRLRTVLTASGYAPRAVSLLPDRSSEILGLAAAGFLYLPTEPYSAEASDTLVVAYTLAELEPDLVVSLRTRAQGQILFEHGARWIPAPPVTADITTLMYQRMLPPWDQRLTITPDAPAAKGQVDDRPPAQIAADILAADPTPDPGDGATPSDTEQDLAAFVATAAPRWPSIWPRRDGISCTGPVPSNYFG